MSPANEDDHPGVAKVKQMWERGEFDKIDEMVRLWTAIQNVGLLGGLIKRFIMWSGIVAAGYMAASGYLTEWIRGVK